MGSAPVVAGVLAQFQKLLDVQVPGFQIGTDGALALAALVDRHRRVVDHFQKRHDALALAVGTFDVGAQSANRRPVIAQAASKFGQHGVVLDGAVDAEQIVWDCGQVAGGQLGAQGARVEQRGRGTHVIK